MLRYRARLLPALVLSALAAPVHALDILLRKRPPASQPAAFLRVIPIPQPWRPGSAPLSLSCMASSARSVVGQSMQASVTDLP